jgi:arylformamidase
MQFSFIPIGARLSGMTAHRASFDASVSFTNGGSLQVTGFKVDLPQAQVTEAEIGQIFLQSLGLLMSGEVVLSNVEIIEEQHRGTRGVAIEQAEGRRFVELSHPIRDGLVTYPGLPAPAITPHLTREASRQVYAPGTEFAMDIITMIGNTGTYLDSPHHRFDGATDLAGLTLEQLADLPVVLARVVGSAARGIDANVLAALGDVRGAAVLLHTGDSARFGTAEYAQWLVSHGAALVGIDAINIDSAADATRPAHTLLLAAGIPIVEHLTGLQQLPPTGARFTAAPPLIEAFGTFPVRAFAVLQP